jgi:hypothetical protein
VPAPEPGRKVENARVPAGRVGRRHAAEQDLIHGGDLHVPVEVAFQRGMSAPLRMTAGAVVVEQARAAGEPANAARDRRGRRLAAAAHQRATERLTEPNVTAVARWQ